MNDCPPNPGSTVMTRTMSTSSAYGSSADSGVPGLTARPAARPASRMARSVGAIGSSISTWNVIESQPASRYSSMYRPGSLIIRWASNGSSVRGRRCLMVFAPNVRFGTKCPSMTSRWTRSAPDFWTRRTAYARFERSDVEDARGDPGATVGHGYSPTPAGTGSWLRSPRRAAALAASRRSRRRATVGAGGSPACSAAS